MSDRWSRWGRIAPLTGIVFVGLLIAGFALSGSTPDSDAPGADVISFYHAHQSKELASAILGAFGVAFFLFFAATLRAHLHRSAVAGGLSRLGFAGGVLLGVGGAIFSSLGLAIADVPDKLDPSAAQALNVLNNDFWFPFAIGLAVFLIGNGLAIARSGALPKWLGWVAFALGILAFTPIGFFAFFVVFAWILVVSVLLFLRGGDEVSLNPQPIPPGHGPGEEQGPG